MNSAGLDSGMNNGSAIAMGANNITGGRGAIAIGRSNTAYGW
jgi:hypothetical protein